MNLFDFLLPPEPPLTPPWLAFPDSYGYLAAGQPVICTRAELERVCAVQPVPLQVWTPESGGLVAPEDVPFLLAVLRRRLLRRPLRVAGVIGAVGGVVVAHAVLTTGLSAGSPAALYLAMLVALLALAGHAAWGAARLTPEGFRRILRDAAVERRVERRPVVHTRWLAGLMIAGAVAQLSVLVGGRGLAGALEFLTGTGDLAALTAAVSGDAVLVHGQWDRLLTAAFVHGGLLHFSVNFLALLVLGGQTEMYTGRGWLPVVFLLSALGGSVLGIVLPPELPSVGNSGGLVGVIAFLGVLAWRRPGQVPPGFLNSILVNVATLVGIGVVGYAYVDNAGHAGGGIVGGLLGLAFIPGAARTPEWSAGRAVRAAGNLALALITAGCAAALWRIALTS